MNVDEWNDKINSLNNIGFVNSGPGIGDNVYYSFVPEAFYETFGKKLIDIEKKWIYDNNPYVIRDNIKCDVIFDIFRISMFFPKMQFISIPDRWCRCMNWKYSSRNPRLYMFEDVSQENIITVHVKGISTKSEMPSYIIKHIKNQYAKDFNIVQLGGNSDIDVGLIDKRGLGLKESAEFIAKSRMFIGVNSGFMNIANCFPRVMKKIVLGPYECSNVDLNNFIPLNSIVGSEWLSFDDILFNTTENDIGITYSYRKI